MHFELMSQSMHQDHSIIGWTHVIISEQKSLQKSMQKNFFKFIAYIYRCQAHIMVNS
jgi:hypothetical protein